MATTSASASLSPSSDVVWSPAVQGAKKKANDCNGTEQGGASDSARLRSGGAVIRRRKRKTTGAKPRKFFENMVVLYYCYLCTFHDKETSTRAAGFPQHYRGRVQVG